MKLVLNRGFTLIEVMIVVAIVAILATVAFPAYTDYLRRGQVPEAFTYLSDYRVKMEQYYQDHRNYGTANTCANAAGTTWGNFEPAGRKFFSLSCKLMDDGQGFVLKATGTGSRTQGHEYTIDQAGAKVTTQFPGASGSKPCWAVKSSDC